VACVRHIVDGAVRREVRPFQTTTKGLMVLSEWLSAEGCTDIVMEATGVYWKPVWHILSDGEFALLLANAAHVKNVPGRKTDVNDATWLAERLAHGLVRGSFVPDQQTQEMRTLYAHPQAAGARAQPPYPAAAEDTGGRQHQARLGDLRHSGPVRPSHDRSLDRRRNRPQCFGGVGAPAHQASPADLEAALRGRVTRHHRFLLGLHLQQIDAPGLRRGRRDAAIDQIDPEVDALVEPFRTAVQLLTTIPGIDELSACVILAKIGRDMSRFPTAAHLISWAGLCPKNDESAGKRRSTRMRKGAPWLKTTLVQCAAAAARKKANYLQAQFHRVRARRGAKKVPPACAGAGLPLRS
jgi:transposase